MQTVENSDTLQIHGGRAASLQRTTELGRRDAGSTDISPPGIQNKNSDAFVGGKPDGVGTSSPKLCGSLEQRSGSSSVNLKMCAPPALLSLLSTFPKIGGFLLQD
jgi:hypothetical protein